MKFFRKKSNFTIQISIEQIVIRSLFIQIDLDEFKAEIKPLQQQQENNELI